MTRSGSVSLFLGGRTPLPDPETAVFRKMIGMNSVVFLIDFYNRARSMKSSVMGQRMGGVVTWVLMISNIHSTE